MLHTFGGGFPSLVCILAQGVVVVKFAHLGLGSILQAIVFQEV